MKKADFGIIGVALVTLLTAFILNGCNDNDRITTETGEPLVVVEQVTLECDTPFSFKAVGLFEDTNVSTEYNEATESYCGEWGVDVSYTVVTPCVPCEDGNATITVVDPLIPIDGNCGCGYELNDCGTLCVESQGIKCGEGTEYNETTETCEVIPPLECPKGAVEVDEICKPVVYPFEDEDCIDGYVEGPRGRMCFLESELDIPTPR